VLLLVALAALLGWGLAVAGGGTPAVPQSSGPGDVELYQRVAARVASGEGYYPAAVAEQFAGGYPTTPAVVVRLPTLTWIHVVLGATGASVALVGLGVAALAAMAVRLDRDGARRAEWAGALLLIGANIAVLATGPVSWFSEAWAGVLLLLALAVHGERRWWPSVALGLAAACLRELALPFLLVMAVLAWPRRRREAMAWLGAIGAFLVIYLLHALAVQAAQPPAPVASNGWLAAGGWPFVLASVSTGSVLATAPLWVAACLVPFALLGWLFAGALSRPALATCLLFMVAFLVVGRPDNAYWGLLYAPVLLVGLAFSPRALATSLSVAGGASSG
jgi:hypothetical protein